MKSYSLDEAQDLLLGKVGTMISTYAYLVQPRYCVLTLKFDL
jgi:hypothetical protein